MIKVNYHQGHFQAVVDAVSGSCSGPLNFTVEYIIIMGCCVLGIIWAAINLMSVTKINVEEGHFGDEENDSDDDSEDNRRHNRHHMPQKQKELLLELGDKISQVHGRLFRAPTSSSSRNISSASSSLSSCSSLSPSSPRKESPQPSLS